MTEKANSFARLTGVALSDIGRKRKNNEDSYGAFPAHGVWCVADGMGGGDDGEVASAAVVKSVDAYLSDLPTVVRGAYAGSQIASGIITAVEDASGWIFRRTKKKGLKGCGSTFVGIVFDATKPDAALALHVGDSRLYRMRGRELKQITKDHSVAEMMGAKDEKDLNPMFRGMILRAVGIENAVEVDQTPLSIVEGDVILVCSDGLSRMVPDKRIGEIIREGGDDVKATARSLIDAANEAGGIDNITVALVKVGELPSAVPVAEIERNEDSIVSSSTVQTLEREYGAPRRKMPWRPLLAGMAVCAVVAFGWVVSRSFVRDRPREALAPSVEAMPAGENVRNVADTNKKERVELPVASNASSDPLPTAALSANALVQSGESVTNAPSSNDESERDAVEQELRAERERRKKAEEAAAGQERERREAAQDLAKTCEGAFVEFAEFVNVVFGKGTSDKARSLCRQLHARNRDADVSMYAADFTAEVAELARKLIVKCGRKGLRNDEAAQKLVNRCKTVVDRDPALPETQRKCLALIEFVAEQRMQGNGRK